MLNLITPTHGVTSTATKARIPSVNLLSPVRRWLNGLTINNADLARFICRTIPTQCPFAREIRLFGRLSLTIPPLCKLNPLYEEVIGLRFRALSYLADECNEDVRCYC